MTPLPEDDETLGSDLLDGLTEISRFVGVSPLRTRWLIKQGTIPAGKFGRGLVASKRAIRQRIAEITSGSGA